MASLDNFHTGNGVLGLRHVRYPDTRDRMRVQELGLVNNRDWDLGHQVPVQQIQYNANDLVSNQHVTPRYTERLDSTVQDLFVPTTPYVQRMRGYTSDSILIYDKSSCSMGNFWGNWFKPSFVPLNQTSKRVRYTPY